MGDVPGERRLPRRRQRPHPPRPGEPVAQFQTEANDRHCRARRRQEEQRPGRHRAGAEQGFDFLGVGPVRAVEERPHQPGRKDLRGPGDGRGRQPDPPAGGAVVGHAPAEPQADEEQPDPREDAAEAVEEQVADDALGRPQAAVGERLPLPMGLVVEDAAQQDEAEGKREGDQPQPAGRGVEAARGQEQADAVDAEDVAGPDDEVEEAGGEQE